MYLIGRQVSTSVGRIISELLLLVMQAGYLLICKPLTAIWWLVGDVLASANWSKVSPRKTLSPFEHIYELFWAAFYVLPVEPNCSESIRFASCTLRHLHYVPFLLSYEWVIFCVCSLQSDVWHWNNARTHYSPAMFVCSEHTTVCRWSKTPLITSDYVSKKMAINRWKKESTNK